MSWRMHLILKRMNANLTIIEFSMVSKVIASHLGLNFSDDKRAIISRNLAMAAKDSGFQNLKGFIAWILSPDRKKNEIESLAPYLTNSETYFWREPQVFSALTQNILTDLIASKKDNNKSINIWSAACSSGEEAYSIAIALHRTIPNIKEWKISILATDINSVSLNKARAGVYGSGSFRNPPEWLKRLYFKSKDKDQYEIIPEISKMVTFSKFNLTHEDFLASVCEGHKMDIIFCRNVLMYFTAEWASMISQNLFNCLSDEGWLVVSSCELSSNLFPQYAPGNFPGAVLYHKGRGKYAENIIQTEDYNIQAFFSSLPAIAPDPKIIDQLLNSDFKKNDLNPQPRSRASEDILNESKISICLLADKGNLEEALSVCNEAISNDRLAPGLYYLRASILQEQDKSNEAIMSLKKAIYLDPDYIMGHFSLGNIFYRLGIIKSAKKYFTNALELLDTLSDDEILAESEGLSAKYIRGIILTSLQTQKTV